ncbi:MAG: rod shape-determining protein [Alphaproteobacteria bacterium]|nr:rod shape-determining protein [Alphaproteobacteria bacterium]MCB9692529.1 rod shape-determining protein [Alphaproteobacteria bacterium]
MLSAVFGLFTQDLAVDLGSSRTRIHLRGTGLVCDEPSVVAVHTPRDGRRKVLAVGSEALPMLGRTPEDIQAIQPVRNGTIEDFEVAEALLLQLVRRAHGTPGLLKPRMAVALPTGCSDMAMRALRDSCAAAGAREIHLVPRPLAAALGAELPIHEPNGHLVVDLGGTSTEISVLSLSHVVQGRVLPGGGEALDKRIVDYVRRHHAIEIGRPTAEHLKCTLGSAVQGGIQGSTTAKGRCLRLGVPRAVEVTAADVQAALAPAIAELADAIREIVESVPPELASDVVENGVILVGGGAELDCMPDALRHLTGLPVFAAESPGTAVSRGVARVMEELDLLERVAS